MHVEHHALEIVCALLVERHEPCVSGRAQEEKRARNARGDEQNRRIADVTLDRYASDAGASMVRR